MIDLSQDQIKILKKIIHHHFPGCEIRIFGSRVTGKAKPYSDIDIALVDKVLLDKRALHRLIEDLQDSKLSYRVDIPDWNQFSDAFQKMLTAHHFETI